jgi:hypothetical protein
MGFTVHQIKQLATGVSVGSILSIVGTLVIMISIFVFKGYRKERNRMVLFLSFCDFMMSISLATAGFNWIDKGTQS